MNIEHMKAAIQEAVSHIQRQTSAKPQYGLILGSGLGELGDDVQNKTVIPYRDIPHFPESTAPGHAGNLILGELSGKPVVLMQGRFHTYEGYSQHEVTFPIQVMAELGIHTLIVTCACGGLNHNFRAGDLMLIRDHINFTGTNPLIGPNDDAVGPRFPVMFGAYTPELRSLAQRVALKNDQHLHEGVYCGITGPVFFTPAELTMLMQWGSDAIGMSTVPEVIVAAHRGLKVLGLAMVTDIAIPNYGHHATGEDVLAMARQAGPRFRKLVRSLLEELPS